MVMITWTRDVNRRVKAEIEKVAQEVGKPPEVVVKLAAAALAQFRQENPNAR